MKYPAETRYPATRLPRTAQVKKPSAPKNSAEQTPPYSSLAKEKVQPLSFITSRKAVNRSKSAAADSLSRTRKTVQAPVFFDSTSSRISVFCSGKNSGVKSSAPLKIKYRSRT